MAQRDEKPLLIGRSSSHFTRVTRIFAAELGVEYDYRTVPNLLSHDSAEYGGNPALRVPVLRTTRESWFGALHICRELERRALRPARVVWPEHLVAAAAGNAQEMVLQAMATEVSLIMHRAGAGQLPIPPVIRKMEESLSNMLAWLELNAPAVLNSLPLERTLSFLEVTLYCLVTHLEFREVAPVTAYEALNDFRRRYAGRESVAATAYHFDD